MKSQSIIAILSLATTGLGTAIPLQKRMTFPIYIYSDSGCVDLIDAVQCAPGAGLEVYWYTPAVTVNSFAIPDTSNGCDDDGDDFWWQWALLDGGEGGTVVGGGCEGSATCYPLEAPADTLECAETGNYIGDPPKH